MTKLRKKMAAALSAVVTASALTVGALSVNMAFVSGAQAAVNLCQAFPWLPGCNNGGGGGHGGGGGGGHGGGGGNRVPEPGTLALVGLAIAGAVVARRRK